MSTTKYDDLHEDAVLLWTSLNNHHDRKTIFYELNHDKYDIIKLRAIAEKYVEENCSPYVVQDVGFSQVDETKVSLFIGAKVLRVIVTDDCPVQCMQALMLACARYGIEIHTYYFNHVKNIYEPYYILM